MSSQEYDEIDLQLARWAIREAFSLRSHCFARARRYPTKIRISETFRRPLNRYMLGFFNVRAGQEGFQVDTLLGMTIEWTDPKEIEVDAP